MKAAWTGDSSDAAATSLSALQDAFTASSDNLHNVSIKMETQGESFNKVKYEVGPGSGPNEEDASSAFRPQEGALMNFRAVIVTAAACALLLSACSEDEGRPVGDPGDLPATSGPAQQPSDEAPPDAPKVTNPITNLEKFKKSPCDMISDDRVKSLGFTNEIPKPDAPNGPGCMWKNDDFENVGIGLLNNQPLGIAGIYRNQEQGLYGYFEPVDVAGYPGVYSDAYDGRPSGACTLSVGVTDTQVFTVTTQVKSDPCERAKQAAEAALQTMSEG